MSTDELLLWIDSSKAEEESQRFNKGRRYIKDQRAEAEAELARRGLLGELARAIAEQIYDIDGHADIWRVFLNADLFSQTIAALAKPFESVGVSKIAAVESRGFLLGGAVAVHLGAGFAAVRKPGSPLPGPKVSRQTAPDYRGRAEELRMQKQSLRKGDRVLFVDDWVESGSTALATKAMVETLGATFIGVATVVDQLTENSGLDLSTYHALVRFPSGHAFGPKAS